MNFVIFTICRNKVSISVLAKYVEIKKIFILAYLGYIEKNKKILQFILKTFFHFQTSFIKQKVKYHFVVGTVSNGKVSCLNHFL